MGSKIEEAEEEKRKKEAEQEWPKQRRRYLEEFLERISLLQRCPG